MNPRPNNEAGVSSVIGVILMVAITVAIASTVYVYASGMMTDNQNVAPTIAFLREDNSLVVASLSGSYDWSDFSVSGNTTAVTMPEGAVSAGDIITNCNGAEMTLSYQGQNLVGIWNFE